MSSQPQWTAPMFAASGGEDHLGLASVSSGQILPDLSPTINVLTPHPRYHSFYSFLLDEFWERDLPRSTRSWVQFFRPRDFIYSVAMHLCDRPEHDLDRGITGSRKTSRLASSDREAFETDFDYIKEPLGGYGLYYRSVLAGLGLIYQGGRALPYPVDVPTEDGKEVAASFRAAIEGSVYYTRYFDDPGRPVPREHVRDFARAACLCQVRAPTAPDGLRLRSRFLRFPAGVAGQRRATFRLFLDIADQTQGHVVDQDAYRHLIFFGAAPGGAMYTPRQDVNPARDRWRLYQAREYYAYALTAMWSSVCDWGLNRGGDAIPIPLPDADAYTIASLDFDVLSSRLEVPAPKLTPDSAFALLLDWLSTIVPGAGTFDDRCGLSSVVNESVLRRLIQRYDDGAARIGASVTMLALLFARFGEPRVWSDPEWVSVSRAGEPGRLSVDAFMRSLRRRIDQGATIGDVALWLLRDYVLLQHQFVATAKLPENTFRFERDGNALRFFAHHNPVEFSDSRFDAISTTVHELGLCGSFAAVDHELTPAGRATLSESDVVE